MKKLGFALITAAWLAGAAHSQAFVIGSGIGQKCYNAAVLSQSVSVTDDSPCDEAIKSRTLNKRDLAATHTNRGIIRMRNNRLETALQDYAIASQLKPNFGPIYLNQGAAMISAGHHQEAIKSLNKALELETENPHAAHYNLGLAHELNGDVASAYHAFQKALELRPNWDLPKVQLERFAVVSEG